MSSEANSPLPVLVSSPAELAEIVAAAAEQETLAFDLEFLSQDRYRPRLCLLQIGWRGHAYLVDTLAVDAAPLVALLGDGQRVVIAHAARQDAAILAGQFGVEVRGLFDTQLAAAFLGDGDQLGLGALVAAYGGGVVDKGPQWTDWSARPLSERQLRYALADVTVLHDLYDALLARLVARNRLPWVMAEGDVVVADAWAAAHRTPDDAWLSVGARGLDAASHAAMVALASWRFSHAVADDKPLSHVMPDKLLIELARARPKHEGDVRAMRGMSPALRNDASALAQVIASSSSATSEPRAAWVAISSRAQLWTDLIVALTAVTAERESIAWRLLATRSTAETLARAVDEGVPFEQIDHPLLRTWRRELLGETLVKFWRGEAAIVGSMSNASGIELVDTQRP